MVITSRRLFPPEDQVDECLLSGLAESVQSAAQSRTCGGSTHGIVDCAHAEGQVMVSYWLAGSTVALDLELAEEVYLNAGADSFPHNTTALRPGIRVSPAAIPFYARAAIPIHSAGSTFNVRYGLGVSVPLEPSGRSALYVEADMDESLGGRGVRAFSEWHVWLNVGLDLRF